MTLTDDERATLVSRVRTELDRYVKLTAPAFAALVDDDEVLTEVQRRSATRLMSLARQIEQAHQPLRAPGPGSLRDGMTGQARGGIHD